jgi:S1-C subfamily serine protease
MIGVQVAPGGSTGPGALVSAVVTGSPADHIGLVAGDTITSLNNTPVASATALGPLVRTYRAGQKVSLGWTTQSGQHKTATATLAAGPAD